jgi:hypothetical protein
MIEKSVVTARACAERTKSKPVPVAPNPQASGSLNSRESATISKASINARYGAQTELFVLARNVAYTYCTPFGNAATASAAG